MENLLEKVQDEGWMGKLGLPIPEDVRQAIDNPSGWFRSLSPIEFLEFDGGKVPTLVNAAFSLPEEELSLTVRNSSLYFLESAYGTNKCYNSKAHRDLAGTGQNILARLPQTKNDIALKSTATQTRDFFLNIPYLSSQQINFNGNMGSISGRLNEMQETNKSLLQQLLDSISNTLEGLSGAARRTAKRAIAKLQKILGLGIKRSVDYQSLSIQSQLIQPQNLRSGSIILPAASAVGASINLIAEINNFLLSGFLMKGITDSIASTFMPAFTSTSSAIVLKAVESKGSDVMRYLGGSIMRQNASLLPGLFGASGTFTGAWGLLMAAAPYVILAAVIGIAALQISKRTDVGNELYIFGKRPTSLDLGYARFAEMEKQEIVAEFPKLKNELVRESGKIYPNTYGFSFDGEKQKLSVDLSSPVPIPMNKEQAELLWNELSATPEFSDLFLADS